MGTGAVVRVGQAMGIGVLGLGHFEGFCLGVHFPKETGVASALS